MVRDDGDLNAETDADAGDGLVAYPVRRRGSDVEGENEASADGRKYRSSEQDGDIIPKYGDQVSGNDAEEADAED